MPSLLIGLLLFAPSQVVDRAVDQFALLNVNTDVDKTLLAGLVKSGTMTWRLWLDGGLDGPM